MEQAFGDIQFALWKTCQDLAFNNVVVVVVAAAVVGVQLSIKGFLGIEGVRTVGLQTFGSTTVNPTPSKLQSLLTANPHQDIETES